MITLRYLLLAVAAVVAVAAVAAAMLGAVQRAEPYVENLALAVAAGKPAKTPVPVTVTTYRAYYYNGVLAYDKGIPVYAVGFGQCPAALPPAVYGKTYTLANNTVHFGQCSLVLPAYQDGRIVNYVPLCSGGTDFEPETASEQVGNYTIDAVLIRCG